MRKRLVTIAIIFIVFIMATACSVKEKEYKVYTNDYVTFNYPKDWDMKVNESLDEISIILGKINDPEFVIQLGVMKEQEIEEVIEQAIIDAKALLSADVVYEEITIDGEEAKELIIESNLLDITIEQLYHILKEEIFSYEIETYFNEYGEVGNFISEMKSNNEKLKELEGIIDKLETENEEENISIMKAGILIDNIKYYIEEDMNSIIKQNIIMSHKGNLRLFIFFQNNKEVYEDKIETVRKIIDSIEYVNNMN